MMIMHFLIQFISSFFDYITELITDISVFSAYVRRCIIGNKCINAKVMVEVDLIKVLECHKLLLPLLINL